MLHKTRHPYTIVHVLACEARGHLRHPSVDILRGLKAGEMSPPIGIGEWQLLLRLEKLTPARLDDQVREQMVLESLDEF